MSTDSWRDDWNARSWSRPLADPNYRAKVWGRIIANVAPTNAGCWEWMKFKNEDGYGAVSVKRRMVTVHQVALAISIGGAWPPPLEVDHLCRNRSCCNPDHLEVVTSGENSRRGKAPEVTGERQRNKTHCPAGHPYDEKNTYRNPRTGYRLCRPCRARRERDRIARKVSQ